MNEKENTNFSRIEEAIEYITTHFKEQPGLDEVAKKIIVSPLSSSTLVYRLGMV